MHRDNKMPTHVAFIMDGNGRWAKKRHLPRTMGHRAGTENLRMIITHARDLGIKHVTFYAFSSENWKRPAEEIGALMEILYTYLRKETDTFVKEGAKLNILGDLTPFSERLKMEIEHSLQRTADCNRITVNIALNYSGRQEILKAVNALKSFEKDTLIDEKIFEKHLYTCDIPDPDLMIRTSGEQRLSHFLLWQSAYTELYFTDVYWPDFDIKAFDEAISVYVDRDRRFGGIDDD